MYEMLNWMKNRFGRRLSSHEPRSDAGGTHFRQNSLKLGPRVIPLRVERLFLADFAKGSRIQR